MFNQLILLVFLFSPSLAGNFVTDMFNQLPIEEIGSYSRRLLNPMNWIKRSTPTPPYNPDKDLTTPEIVARHGYPAETHVVKTEDGYLLSIHRIPCGRSGCSEGHSRGQPVLLQHGLLSSSADWILSGPDKALGFILADLGYDVWLGNARGNTYSKAHTRLSTDDAAFWDFSWDEMAKYDIPSFIDFIYSLRDMEQNLTETSGSRDLLYVGHSMGTTMLFAMLSSMPEYNQKLKGGFALAPVAYMNNVKSPIRLLAPFSKNIEMLFKFFGANDFLPNNKIMKLLAKYGCEITEAEKILCENTVFVLCGFDKAQFNDTLQPVILSHTPAGTSTKTVIHFAQEIQADGNFQRFDYGTRENLRRYGESTPPKYEVDNITLPIAFFYADNDWLSGTKDVAKLFDQLHNSAIGLYKIPFEKFNHVDYLWGKDAPLLVYQKLIEIMAKYRA